MDEIALFTLTIESTSLGLQTNEAMNIRRWCDEQPDVEYSISKMLNNTVRRHMIITFKNRNDLILAHLVLANDLAMIRTRLLNFEKSLRPMFL